MRKVIQIATMPQYKNVGVVPMIPAALYALCDDGSVWAIDGSEVWYKLKSIPQDK